MAQEGPIASAAPPANTVGTTQIIDGQVALVDMANLASDRLIGRDTAGSGAPEALTVGGGVEFTGSGGIQRSALTGVVTAAAGSGTTTITAGAVTSAMLRDSAAVSIIGRSANTSGVPADIAAGANGDVLRRTADAVGFGTIPSTSVTGLGTAAAVNTGTGAGDVPTITQADARYQGLDADLTALAASAATAGLVERTGAAAYDTRAIGVGGAASVPTRADADARYQALDVTLTNLATMGTAADKFLYTTGVDTFAEAAITSGARAFVAGTATAAQVAALGAESAWTYVILGSDFTTNSATSVAITGLGFTPAVSKTYVVEAQLGLRTGVAGIAPRPGVAWNTGNDDGWAFLQWQESGSAAFTIGTSGTDFSNDPVLPADNSSTWPCTIVATLVTGSSAAGTFQLTLKSETAANNVSAKKGSWIRYKTIA